MERTLYRTLISRLLAVVRTGHQQRIWQGEFFHNNFNASMARDPFPSLAAGSNASSKSNSTDLDANHDDLRSMASIDSREKFFMFHTPMSFYLTDDMPWSPHNISWLSASEAVEHHTKAMRLYLDGFEKIFASSQVVSPAHSSRRPYYSVEVRGARIPVPGENQPYRLDDGQNTSQPRRRVRRPTNPGLEAQQGRNAPTMTPRLRRRRVSRMAGMVSLPQVLEDPPIVEPSATATGSSLTVDCQDSAGPAPLETHPGQSSISYTPPQQQVQQQALTREGFGTQLWSGPMPPALRQQVGRPSRKPSDRGQNQGSVQHNNSVWQPNLGLFAQDAHSELKNSSLSADIQVDWAPLGGPNSGISYPWPLSSADAVKEMIQPPLAASTCGLSSTSAPEFGMQSASQEHLHGSNSGIPSLSFDLSSSQSHVSLFDSPTNQGPTLSEESGDQLQIRHNRDNFMHYFWTPATPDGGLLLLEECGGDENDENRENEDNLLGKEKDENEWKDLENWEDWLNYPSD
jgi:hypothetical protein